MDINTIFEQLSQTDLRAVTETINIQELTLTPQIRIALIVGIVLSLLWCFFGLKLIRLWAAVFGLVIGFAIGAGAASSFGLETMMVLIIGLVVGIILACLSAVIYHVGAFLIVWIVGIAISGFVIRPQDLVGVLICAGIGLVLALVALKFTVPIIVVLTSIYGAMGAGPLISTFLPIKGNWIPLVITVVLAILGIAVQFLMESGKRKRQSLKKAKEIREKNSTENEVEKARAMMENLDQIPENDDEFEDYGDEFEDYDDEFEDYDEELDDDEY